MYRSRYVSQLKIFFVMMGGRRVGTLRKNSTKMDIWRHETNSADSSGAYISLILLLL